MKPDASAAQRRAEAALIVNTIIWGATFVVVKQALRDVSPVLFLALRFTLATVVLLVLFRGSWSHPRNPRWSLAGGALAGVFLFSGYAFQTIGLQFTTAPKSAFLTGLTAVMTPLLAAAVYRKMPRAMEIGGVLLATGGMALMTLPGCGAGAINRGDLLTVCCAACYAAHILTLSRYSATASFELLATAQIGISALLAWSLFHGDGNAAHPMDAGSMGGDRGHRYFRHRAGFHLPGMGAALHHFHAHGADLHAGAGIRLDHFVPADRRDTLRARGGGRRADPGGHPGGGSETVASGGVIGRNCMSQAGRWNQEFLGIMQVGSGGGLVQTINPVRVTLLHQLEARIYALRAIGRCDVNRVIVFL